jgi:uncharacterized protein YjbJ (UPF0337 family)
LETRGKNDDTLGEEVSALGQRTKGAAKDMVGDLIDDPKMEAEGKIENAAGRARQATNNVMDETDGVRGATTGRYVTGLYTPEQADRAYQELTSKHGHNTDDISLMISEAVSSSAFPVTLNTGQRRFFRKISLAYSISSFTFSGSAYSPPLS